jgi:hypothetical protein
MDPHIALRLVEQFDRMGVEVERPIDLLEPGDFGAVGLRRRRARQRYMVTYLPDMTFTEGSHLARKRFDDPLLVLGDRISERSANSFREAGIQYLDAAGNAYITFDDVLIDIRGRRHTSSGSKTMPFDRPANLFSPRRARVVFALIAWPELSRATVREIAAAAGVSLGLAHDGIELLEKHGYLDSAHSRELHGRRELLDYWTATYPSGLSPTLDLAQFAGDIEAIRPVNGDQPLYISGESAVREVLRPVSLTVYVEQLDPRLPVVNRWRSDGQLNIAVRRKFWTDPSRDERWSGIPEPAPWPLVYADLMATGESRQREAAQQLREDHAGLREM